MVTIPGAGMDGVAQSGVFNMKTIICFPKDRPNCEKCKKNTTPASGDPRPNGTRYYLRLCRGCEHLEKYGRRNHFKRQYHKRGREYIRYKKDQCEDCGFKAIHACQLDVDHVDGNRQNNELANLRTLCANCHRLKTQIAKDNYNKKWRLAG